MGCHTWFYRPIKENEIATNTCEYSDEMFGEDRYTDIDTPHDLFRIGGYPDDKLLSLQQMETDVQLNAAQARTDIDVPEGTDTSDDDIMNDKDF